MDWEAFAFAATFMAAVIAALQWRELRALYRWWKDRPQRAARRAQTAASLQSFREEWAAANPEGPPITPEEDAAFRVWLAEQERPALRMTPAPGPAAPDGCRLGGPAWLEAGQSWPLSSQGKPMEFLAQIDFAALAPPLPGFPHTGVAQVFVPTDDDLMGMNPDAASASSVAVLVRANGSGTARHDNIPSSAAQAGVSAFRGDKVRRDGIPLVPTPFSAPIGWSQWHAERRIEGYHRRPGFAAWEALLDHATASAACHHVGGYPVFVQYDFRSAGHYDDYDTCLLRLTSDAHLQWGDAGEANLLIRSADLARGDFSRVIFWWDCS